MYASLLTLLLLLQTGSAAATHPRAAAESAANKNQAQALLREGTRLYRKGQYQEALDRFTGAYALYPSPKLHFNIAQANRELGRPVEALAAFERFLADPAGSPRPVTDEARHSAADLRAQLGQVQVTGDAADAEVLLDGAAVGRTPLRQPIWCTPGKHLLSLTREGFVPFEESVTVAAGASATVSASLRRVKLEADPYQGTYAAPPLPAAPPDRPTLWPRLRRSWWFWGAIAAVAVGTGIAVAAATGRSDVPPSSLGTQRAFP
jgi:tetratricopeptide (TPR) repeat protein